jgi:hypothetical protein
MHVIEQSSPVFPLIILIPPLLHTHLSLPHYVYDSRDQAAFYHTVHHNIIQGLHL